MSRHRTRGRPLLRLADGLTKAKAHLIDLMHIQMSRMTLSKRYVEQQFFKINIASTLSFQSYLLKKVKISFQAVVYNKPWHVLTPRHTWPSPAPFISVNPTLLCWGRFYKPCLAHFKRRPWVQFLCARARSEGLVRAIVLKQPLCYMAKKWQSNKAVSLFHACVLHRCKETQKCSEHSGFFLSFFFLCV